MLNFFRKTGRSRSTIGDEITSTASIASSQQNDDADDILLVEAEKFCAENQPHDASSTIVDDRPIVHIVTDPTALSHFVQYLDTRADDGAALAMLKFWLDADSFRAAAEAEHCRHYGRDSNNITIYHQQKSHQHLLTKSQSLDETALGGHQQQQQLNESPPQQPPLTDDEKSRARRSERRRFQTSLATAAVRIFRKYLTAQSGSSSKLRVEVPATILARISLALGAGKTDDDDDDDDVDDGCGGQLVDGTQTVAVSIDEPDDCGQRQRSDDGNTSTTTPTTNRDAASRLSAIFRPAQHHVLASLERQHLDGFIESSFYARFSIDVLTSESLRIADILHCQSALFYLAEFLEQDGRRRMLDFWMAAVTFRQQMTAGGRDGDEDDDGDDEEDDVAAVERLPLEQARADALVLYDRYFSLQAPAAHRLALGDSWRTTIEQNICTAHRRELVGCFDGARRVIERYLEQKYFRAFVTSPLFGRYLAELLHKSETSSMDGNSRVMDKSPCVETIAGGCNSGGNGRQTAATAASSAHPNETQKHRKSASECLSRTISTQNTLLAMDTRHSLTLRPSSSNSFAKSNAALTASSMQIDGRQLCDPEALWKRDYGAAGDCGEGRGLSFGRVNAMGRYERDFELHAADNAEHQHDKRSMGGGHTTTTTTMATPVNASATATLMNAVRRLVRLPEDRAKEELAWEVAEMIVRDITNVTLRGGVDPNDVI